MMLLLQLLLLHLPPRWGRRTRRHWQQSRQPGGAWKRNWQRYRRSCMPMKMEMKK